MCTSLEKNAEKFQNSANGQSTIFQFPIIHSVCAQNLHNLSFLKPRPNDRNMPTQHITTLLGATCCVRFGHRAVMCCDMLGAVGSSLKMGKFEPTTPNTSQHVATRWPTHATCCAQQCCDMSRWHVAII